MVFSTFNLANVVEFGLTQSFNTHRYKEDLIKNKKTGKKKILENVEKRERKSASSSFFSLSLSFSFGRMLSHRVGTKEAEVLFGIGGGGSAVGIDRGGMPAL